MALAISDKAELLKAIRRHDGFVVEQANTGILIRSLGYSLGALGGWVEVVRLSPISRLIDVAATTYAPV
jgi:hypothetical protein